MPGQKAGRRASIVAGGGGAPSANLYNSGTFGKTYTLGRLLGEGAFGRVYQCTHNESHDQVAVKMVPTNQKDFKEAAIGECEDWRSFTFKEREDGALDITYLQKEEDHSEELHRLRL